MASKRIADSAQKASLTAADLIFSSFSEWGHLSLLLMHLRHAASDVTRYTYASSTDF